MDPLSEGKKAPAFSLKDKDGKTVKLSGIDTPYTLLYFYPKDNTPGCTVEALGFNKLLPQFKKAGITVIGISGGDEKSKTKFCEKHGLTITLVSDTDFAVSTKYGVYGEKKFMGRTYNGISRVSFLLDKNKKIIKVWPKVKVALHPKEVLDYVKSLKK